MSILGSIMSAIVHHAGAAAPAPAQGTPSVSASASASGTPTASPAAGSAPVDVEAVLTKLASQSKERLDWRGSIVDLMKLLNLDSSLTARKELATELHYTGDKNNSAVMNVWLHEQVMHKLAENGGKVPADLLHK